MILTGTGDYFIIETAGASVAASHEAEFAV
jgi:hypothetical protein